MSYVQYDDPGLSGLGFSLKPPKWARKMKLSTVVAPVKKFAPKVLRAVAKLAPRLAPFALPLAIAGGAVAAGIALSKRRRKSRTGPSGLITRAMKARLAASTGVTASPIGPSQPSTMPEAVAAASIEAAATSYAGPVTMVSEQDEQPIESAIDTSNPPSPAVAGRMALDAMPMVLTIAGGLALLALARSAYRRR